MLKNSWKYSEYSSSSDIVIKEKDLDSNFRAGRISECDSWVWIMVIALASLCVARLEPQKQLAAPKKPAV